MRAALEAVDLCKNFKGLAAVSSVSLKCSVGNLHAVIGPNGAGKSTLINLLSGSLPCDAGKMFIDGHDVTRLNMSQMSLRGLGRSFQRTNIFGSLTVLENCEVAAQSRFGISNQMFRSTKKYTEVTKLSESVIEKVGLGNTKQRIADELSHGEQRQLEIALTLATKPKVLLLDEPLAGMGLEEAKQIINLLRDLRQDYAIVLVEHDMNAVFALADTLTVMVDGEVIASGSPDLIKNDRRVRLAYLGEE